jgi:hypothetical protein
MADDMVLFKMMALEFQGLADRDAVEIDIRGDTGKAALSRAASD